MTSPGLARREPDRRARGDVEAEARARPRGRTRDGGSSARRGSGRRRGRRGSTCSSPRGGSGRARARARSDRSSPRPPKDDEPAPFVEEHLEADLVDQLGHAVHELVGRHRPPTGLEHLARTRRRTAPPCASRRRSAPSPPGRSARARGPGCAARARPRRRSVGDPPRSGSDTSHAGTATPAGRCWVMQCGPPPPSFRQLPGTGTTSRSGNIFAICSSACSSSGRSAIGITRPPSFAR